MKLTTLQKNISKATTAIAKSADLITKITNERKDKTAETRQAIKGLTDAISFLGNAQQKITIQRKEAQKSSLPFDIRGICEMPSDGDEWLYGDDIKKAIRDAKEQRRLTMTIPRSQGSFHSRGPHTAYGKKRGHFLGRRGGQAMANTGQRRRSQMSYTNWNRKQVARKQ